MIDFNTKNLIIAYYPQGAGGKFLINCLGLSDKAVLQHADYIHFNQTEKIEFLTTRIQDTANHWADLGLGCSELFGIGNDVYYKYPPSIIKNMKFNSAIETLSNNNLKFFIVAHWPSQCKKYLSTWPNATIIHFKYSDEFINFRTPNSEIKVHVEPEVDFPNEIIWDNNNYFSADTTVNEIKKLYKLLDLNNFNETAIQEYYALWIAKLKEIKNQ